jgi:hypothetical protein
LDLSLSGPTVSSALSGIGQIANPGSASVELSESDKVEAVQEPIGPFVVGELPAQVDNQFPVHPVINLGNFQENQNGEDHMVVDQNLPEQQLNAEGMEQQQIAGVPEQQLVVEAPEEENLIEGQNNLQNLEELNEGNQEEGMEVDQFNLPEFLPAAIPQGQNAQIILPNYLPAANPDRALNLNFNFNMALTQFHTPGEADPAWAAFMGGKLGLAKTNPLPDVYRLWAKHFSLVGCPEQVINIPTDWAAFFTVMLLSPNHFDWAKSFLASKAWNLMIKHAKSDALMAFALPSKCPEGAEVCCDALAQNLDVLPEVESVAQNEDADNQQSVAHSEMAVNQQVIKTLTLSPVVETETRRSPRIRSRNRGFKHNSCPSKNCLACVALPPSMTKTMLKTLGEEYCKVKAGKLHEEDLSTKKKSKQAIGGHKTKKVAERRKAQYETEGQDPAKKFKKYKTFFGFFCFPPL